jgi:hypothetical protein
MPDSKKNMLPSPHGSSHKEVGLHLSENSEMKATSRRVVTFCLSKRSAPTYGTALYLMGYFLLRVFAFNAAENMLVGCPLIDWSNARKVVDGHTHSKEQMNSITRADHFVRICRKEEQNVVKFGSTAYRQKVQKNREALAAIIEATILCGQKIISMSKSVTISSPPEETYGVVEIASMNIRPFNIPLYLVISLLAYSGIEVFSEYNFPLFQNSPSRTLPTRHFVSRFVYNFSSPSYAPADGTWDRKCKCTFLFLLHTV